MSTNKASHYLVIENLTKKFGEFVALKDINLKIDESEFVCFLGPSGCGKTTLLRAIAGLDLQTSGHIFQAGKDISVLPPSGRDFGIVFQSYALFPNLTVAKNVAYGLENAKLAKDQIKKRVDELLDMVGLPEKADAYPANLSGGQQQRIALARALATSPSLLLLDEPLSALDAKVRVFLRHEIKQLQRKLGVTTIMVTHDQEEALTMADRIVVMEHGVVEQVGTPNEIYQQPKSEFVADFIGTMNFFDAQVIANDQIKIGELEFLHDAKFDMAIGDKVTAAIRPEEFAFSEKTESQGQKFDATIKEIEFLGNLIRLRLNSQKMGSTSFIMNIEERLFRANALNEGDTINLSVIASPRLYPQN